MTEDCNIEAYKNTSKLINSTISFDGEAIDLTTVDVEDVVFKVSKELEFGESIVSKSADTKNKDGEVSFNLSSNDLDIPSGLYYYTVAVSYTDDRRYIANVGRFLIRKNRGES